MSFRPALSNAGTHDEFDLFASPGEPHTCQRVGALVVIPELLRELGQDPDPVIRSAGIEGSALQDPEAILTFEQVGRLFRACVEATGCEHFGLLVGQRSATASLNLVGRLMRNAPTLKNAITDLCVNQQRYVRGSVVYLIVTGDIAMWGFAVHYPNMDAVEQFSEAAIAVGCNYLRELVGVTPNIVLSARSAPKDITQYQRFYGSTPQFDADQYALAFPARCLDLPVRGADRDLRAQLERMVASYWAVREPGFTDRVARILRGGIHVGTTSLEDVARDLLLGPRTLNRRLQAEGSSFRALLSGTRYLVARQLLASTRTEVTPIALALGYADSTAFTRAFRTWSGEAPSEWRRQFHSRKRLVTRM